MEVGAGEAEIMNCGFCRWFEGEKREGVVAGRSFKMGELEVAVAR